MSFAWYTPTEEVVTAIVSEMTLIIEIMMHRSITEVI
jgi:hypothetical protein